MEKRRVVITGMGAITPLGKTAEDSWTAAKAGVCGIDTITLYDSSSMKVHLAGEVKDFNPEDYMPRREARRMDRFTQFAMVAADEAMKQSGLDLENEDTNRIGVILSSGIGGMSTIQSETLKCFERGNYDRISPFFIPMIIANMAAGQVAIKYGLHGMCTCPVSACASGSNAIGDAFRHIRDGYAEVMLCGGAEPPWPRWVWAASSACTPSPPPPIPPAPPSPSTRSAPASSWAKAPACWCWRPMTTPRPAAPRFWARSWVTAPTATLTTSPRPAPTAPAPPPV